MRAAPLKVVGTTGIVAEVVTTVLPEVIGLAWVLDEAVGTGTTTAVVEVVTTVVATEEVP